MFTKETQLRITNETTLSIVKIEVSEVDNYDWDKNCGPHRSFAGQTIGPKSSMQKREEVRRSASNCPFTMTLHFSDGSVDTFRINQKFAIGDAGANFQHKIRSHDIFHNREGDKTLVIKIKHTEQQLQDIEAQKLKKEGNAKLQQKNYEQAMKLFDQALQKATSASTKQDIINQQYQLCRTYGQTLMQQAMDLEVQNKAKEAEAKLNDAKSKLQKAQSMKKTTEIQNALTVCNSKIEGNKLFNEALNKEKEAYDMFNKAKDGKAYDSAQNKYKEALHKYEEALKKFEAGAKLNSKLAESVKITKEQIEEVKKVVEKIEMVELETNVQNVKVDDQKGKENDVNQTINTNIHQQID